MRSDQRVTIPLVACQFPFIDYRLSIICLTMFIAVCAL
jgi:hypothetical protein